MARSRPRRLPTAFCLAAVTALASGTAPTAAFSQAVREPAEQAGAQPANARDATIEAWGTLGQMVEPVWVTQGQASPRTSISTWSKPLQVLVIRHGASDRMKLGSRYADTVQTVGFDAATGTFDITYTYEDGRKLTTVGSIEPDGTFAEELTAADGSRQRNLYRLDTPRKMRIVRQKWTTAGWVTASTVVKIGETPAERIEREAAERRAREAEAARIAAEEARREAEREAAYAEAEAERQADEAESQAQRQRSWAMFQNDMRQIVQRNQDQIDDSRRFQERIRVTVANAEAERQRRIAEANRAAAEAQRLRNAQTSSTNTPVRIAPPRPAQPTVADRSPPSPATPVRLQQPTAQQMQQQADQKQRDAEAKRLADNPVVSWKEGVVLCEPPKSGSGDWSCHGPLQTTYGVPDKPSGRIAVTQACGGSGNSVRELGQAGGFRTYGCGWGINPLQSAGHDPADRFGVFVPGRTTFSCPRKQTTVCTTRN